MALVLHFPIVIPCLLEHVVSYFNVYTVTRTCSLMENVAVLLKRKNKIISIVAKKNNNNHNNFYLYNGEYNTNS